MALKVQGGAGFSRSFDSRFSWELLENPASPCTPRLKPTFDADDWASDAPARARRDAAEACMFCPARHPCASYADAAGEPSGVWGGVDHNRASDRRESLGSRT